MTIRKRWIAAGAALVMLCLVSGCLGAAFLTLNIPGVSRLFRDAPAAPTAIPIGEGQIASLLNTATLTATPSPVATEVSPSPTFTQSATATVVQPTDPPEPAATLPATTLPLTPTPAPSLTPTWTPSPTPIPPTPTRPAPTATPRPQWIAFESDRGENNDYEIVAMGPDGSRQTNLTNSWADDLAPAWAPGGRHIAFVSLRDTAAGKWGLGKSSIYVMAFDPASGTSGAVWRVTDDGGSDGWPTWSPDGTRIAFQSDRSGNWDIWIANADGTGLVQLTHHPANERFAGWSPDGKKIAFASKRSGDEDVWVLDVDAALSSGDDAGAINLTGSSSRDRYPFWSPDGNRLTFNTNRDGDFEVYIMNADGSNPHNVSNSPQSTEGLADWSPDGGRLVLYSDLEGNKEVYTLDLASLVWINISNHPASDEFCTWSR